MFQLIRQTAPEYRVIFPSNIRLGSITKGEVSCPQIAMLSCRSGLADFWLK